MILTNIGSGVSVTLPNDLLWKDEFEWSPVATNKSTSLSGALIIEQGVRQAGRPISLEPPPDMAWVKRSVADTLRAWCALPGMAENTPRLFTLQLQYPTDTRSFTVMMESISATPVKEFPSHSLDDAFIVSLKLLQVA